jgi:enoyl-CoA hydratase
VVEPENLRERVLELAAEVAAGATVAQALTKEAIDRGLDGTLDDGLAVERKLFTEVFRSDDSQVGVASFLEHGPGKAMFTGS